MAEIMFCDLCGKEMMGDKYQVCLYEVDKSDDPLIDLDVCPKCRPKVSRAITDLRSTP